MLEIVPIALFSIVLLGLLIVIQVLYYKTRIESGEVITSKIDSVGVHGFIIFVQLCVIFILFCFISSGYYKQGALDHALGKVDVYENQFQDGHKTYRVSDYAAPVTVRKLDCNQTKEANVQSR